MMKAKLMPETKISSLEKLKLRRQLDEYYASVSDYMAFSAESHQVECWSYVENKIRERIKDNTGDTLNLLEIGAGRSGFGEWLKEQGLRNAVNWSVQDVTVQNADWLESQADYIIYGDVSEISERGCFDVIFSTYVLEHVTNPAFHLEQLHSLLRPGGSLFIFCPRYDMPGYFCPSSRHLSWLTRMGFGMRWAFARCGSWLSDCPAFLIQTDLAAFHGPFFPDADAVHWVSLLDLKLWARSKGALVRRLKFGRSRLWSKDWIVKQLLTCAIEINKS